MFENFNFKQIEPYQFKGFTFPVYASIKIDGELNYWNGEYLQNKYGTKREFPPLKGFPPLYGELYYNEGKDFYEALKYLKNGSEFLKFAIFPHQPISDTTTSPQKHPNLTILEAKKIQNLKALEDFYYRTIEEGYEGIVIKAPEGMYKAKRNYEDVFFITGVRKKKWSVVVGRREREDLGHCSLMGWDNLWEMIKKEEIIGQDKENYYITPKIKVEVGFLGWAKNKLRHPRIKRLML